MPDHLKPEAQAVAEIVHKSTEPRTLTVKDDGGADRTVILMPDGSGGWTYDTTKGAFADYREAPERREGVASFTELDSFIAHAKRFADADSAVFADRTPSQPSLLSVLDYHKAGATSSPRFGRHRGRYAFPLADEWTAWHKSNGKAMDLESFALFLETRLADVADPAGAGDGANKFAALLSSGFASASKLLELSRGLTVHVGRKIVNHANLASGEATMSFQEEHSDAGGKPLKIPGAFLIGIPVFRAGPLYQIPARLRYRMQGGQVSFSYEMYRAEQVFDHAFGEAVDKVKAETSLPVLFGSPE